MSDQMSFPCPQCQRSVSADAWQALDLAKHSEWRQQLLQGQLQHLHCPHCQALALPFAVHDPIGEQVIFYIPEHLSLPPEMIPQIQGYLGNALMLAMDGPPPEYILNHALCRDAEELRALISDRSSEATPKPKTDRLLDFTDLRELLNELSQPARTPDMPRRVQLCRKALNLLSRGQDPQLWADLQGEFGNSLSQSPFGERAENLEQAIAAYQQALEVHTRATLPVKWAMTMQNLGGAYWKRLQGERGGESGTIHCGPSTSLGGVYPGDHTD
ncbi:MAG: hypothetical protein GY801_15175 [bacterium]|nr:hypothetical protein [bacterium]